MPHMYENILVCLDNSEHSALGAELAVEVARRTGARLTGLHVYAARLHNDRFRQLEAFLPPQYRAEEVLREQRAVHSTLITRGLEIISDSYMGLLKDKAACAGLAASAKKREGKNYREILAESVEGGYDLVVLGALGLGRVETSRIGSVAERVARGARTDVLVARRGLPAEGRILVAIDGSPLSFGGLERALVLSRAFGMEVEAVSAFDPDYHQTAFRSIAGVLREEDGEIFRFKEQERLHTEIIDKNLAALYRDHLRKAVRLAEEHGFGIRHTLLSGKPFDRIIRYAEETRPFILVVGRSGVHASPDDPACAEIGSTTENCLREVGCNVYISCHAFMPEYVEEDKGPLWREEALELLGRIPSHARGIVKKMVEEAASAEGLKVVSGEFMWKIRKRMGL